ncbi:alkanesulfonate monooxygenase SsuD/methylene tetrahydromethanopterin reductase-like flavin-dependent oxidoreductase (luciferase family) [Lipingzhangella halophila]|uniref:Alkanesulfonate monooxygenase SsuD/methylene tetrahydromethanopterin reductase-like flavin-dependent oxidoreductase (Luciferase family) n=1 Tax=Lipingzhangella halophila TaxID=1783352 RepID=A0A7W7RJ33_9ACTN|nr:LLM class flavin-dependent oxidoreductase [Lipingzhangella halophila]MBB4932912.1 alkanesulfonate monooxygenase SsuD/methylene tetrahydromethanopterin reductase-like flavin-dependent oxidoreductase (luciferase family) [Lipingzhangella halophila]
MTDYGHELQFGTFITPVNTDPHRPVRLARVAERAGLDIVTFQDHPYQAAFHDTWTLMTWIAAATEHITVAGSVLNLPLRQPAVLARSAASLDLLSGGRFTMPLGAGAFWDAIAAMGGPRRTPGEAIEALGEALQIVRGLWDTSTPRPLRVAGKHYQVSGAKRGPAPAHDIPVWLGLYKPRGLRLVGREADGWLVSTGYLQDGEPGPSNAIIDEAAEEAGRDPAEIRRVITVGGSLRPVSSGYLQGPADQWVEELTALALQGGAGTIITMSDEPDFIRTFGEEIAPAVREAVAAERSSG